MWHTRHHHPHLLEEARKFPMYPVFPAVPLLLMLAILALQAYHCTALMRIEKKLDTRSDLHRV